jgi:hypothetical protein
LRLVKGVNFFSGHVFGSRPLNASQFTAHIRLCFSLVNKKILTGKNTLLQAVAKIYAALGQPLSHELFSEKIHCAVNTEKPTGMPEESCGPGVGKNGRNVK